MLRSRASRSLTNEGPVEAICGAIAGQTYDSCQRSAVAMQNQLLLKISGCFTFTFLKKKKNNNSRRNNSIIGYKLSLGGLL